MVRTGSGSGKWERYRDIRNIGRRRPQEEKFLEGDKRQGNYDREGLPRPKSDTTT